MLNAEVYSECKHVMKGHKGGVLCAKFTADGTYCMTGGQDRTIRLWNPHRGLFIKQYTGTHNYEINDICIFKDNSKFVSAGGDKAAYMSDVASAKILKKFSGHIGKLNCCELMGDDSILLTGGYDKHVRIWDLKSHTHRPVQELKEATDSITCMALTDDTIITGCVDGNIRTYDVRMGRLTTDLIHAKISSINLCLDNSLLLVSCLDSTLRLFERTNAKILNTYKSHKNSNYKINSQFSVKEDFVVCGSENNKIYVWDILTKTPSHTAYILEESDNKYGGVVFCVRTHRRNDLMISTHNNGCVNVWQTDQK